MNLSGLNPTFSVGNIQYSPTHPKDVVFTADLFVDDKKVGTVENHGSGCGTRVILDNPPAIRTLLKNSAEHAGYDVIEYYIEHLMDVAEEVK